MPAWVLPAAAVLVLMAPFGLLGWHLGKQRGKPVLGAVLGACGVVGLLPLLVQEPGNSPAAERARQQRKARRAARGSIRDE